jgi:SAM-dependent methyltransferase
MRTADVISLKIESPSRAWSNAAAYNHTGKRYTLYADGSSDEAPQHQYAHADTIVWNAISHEIDCLHREGVRTIRMLDAGCGPGVWMKRIAEYTNSLGGGLEAVGFDISSGQLELARDLLKRVPGEASGTRSIRFVVHDLEAPLPWEDGEFHMALSNFAVLNHLTKQALPAAVEGLCRVASHRVIATLRAVASPPTSCITGPDDIVDFRQDCTRGELRVSLNDGSEHRLTLNLYSAGALEHLFAKHSDILDLRAVDLFFNRFAPNAKWTGSEVDALPGREEVVHKLKDLEEQLCRARGWIDHGTHLLVIAQPKHLNAGGRI